MFKIQLWLFKTKWFQIKQFYYDRITEKQYYSYHSPGWESTSVHFREGTTNRWRLTKEKTKEDKKKGGKDTRVMSRRETTTVAWLLPLPVASRCSVCGRVGRRRREGAARPAAGTDDDGGDEPERDRWRLDPRQHLLLLLLLLLLPCSPASTNMCHRCDVSSHVLNASFFVITRDIYERYFCVLYPHIRTEMEHIWFLTCHHDTVWDHRLSSWQTNTLRAPWSFLKEDVGMMHAQVKICRMTPAKGPWLHSTCLMLH